MNVSALLTEVETLGGTVGIDQDNLVLNIPEEFPNSIIDTLREQKSEVIAYLISSKELAEIERRVSDEGYVLLKSAVLDDFIAFHRDDVDPSTIPEGFVPYSEVELMQLFKEEGPSLSSHSLQRIHTAKKFGAVVKSNNPRKDGGDVDMPRRGMA